MQMKKYKFTLPDPMDYFQEGNVKEAIYIP
jgi:hypothetical protein